MKKGALDCWGVKELLIFLGARVTGVAFPLRLPPNASFLLPSALFRSSADTYILSQINSLVISIFRLYNFGKEWGVLYFEKGTSYVFLTGLRSLVLGSQEHTAVSTEEKFETCKG